MLVCPLCFDFICRIQKIFYCEIWQLRVNYHEHNSKLHVNLPPLWNKLYALVIIIGTRNHTQFLNFHLWTVFKYLILMQFHDRNWFLIILLFRKQWETKYRTKKLTLNVALSFFSFALGVDHTPWWKKNYTFSAQCRGSCSKATDWEQLTKQQ